MWVLFVMLWQTAAAGLNGAASSSANIFMPRATTADDGTPRAIGYCELRAKNNSFEPKLLSFYGVSFLMLSNVFECF